MDTEYLRAKTFHISSANEHTLSLLILRSFINHTHNNNAFCLKIFNMYKCAELLMNERYVNHKPVA